MHTIIYLTGPQGSGKSILSMGFRNATEIEVEVGNIAKIRKEVERSIDYKEIVVVTSQKHLLQAEEWLRDFAREYRLNFFSISLTASNLK